MKSAPEMLEALQGILDYEAGKTILETALGIIKQNSYERHLLYDLNKKVVLMPFIFC